MQKLFRRTYALVSFLSNFDTQCSLNVWHRGLHGEDSVMYQDKEILRIASKHLSLVDCWLKFFEKTIHMKGVIRVLRIADV